MSTIAEVKHANMLEASLHFKQFDSENLARAFKWRKRIMTQTQKMRMQRTISMFSETKALLFYDAKTFLIRRLNFLVLTGVLDQKKFVFSSALRAASVMSSHMIRSWNSPTFFVTLR